MPSLSKRHYSTTRAAASATTATSSSSTPSTTSTSTSRSTSTSTSSSPSPASSPIHICIVGTGPGAMYTAKYLLRDIPNVHIDMLDRLPIPYGLVRFGEYTSKMMDCV